MPVQSFLDHLEKQRRKILKDFPYAYACNKSLIIMLEILVWLKEHLDETDWNLEVELSGECEFRFAKEEDLLRFILVFG